MCVIIKACSLGFIYQLHLASRLDGTFRTSRPGNEYNARRCNHFSCLQEYLIWALHSRNAGRDFQLELPTRWKVHKLGTFTARYAVLENLGIEQCLKYLCSGSFHLVTTFNIHEYLLSSSISFSLELLIRPGHSSTREIYAKHWRFAGFIIIR